MGMLYLCSRKIEHAPACNRRSLSFKCEVLYTLLLGNEKGTTSRPPLQSPNPEETLEEKQRENKTAKDSHSFFDRLTYPK